MDYDSLLSRGRAGLPKKIEERRRFEVPAVKRQIEGKKTIIINFVEICGTINRDPDAVAKFLFREIGTAGSRADGRLILSGAFSQEELDAAVKKYVDSYVICKECHLPDTKIIKEQRAEYIKCEACGAKYRI